MKDFHTFLDWIIKSLGETLKNKKVYCTIDALCSGRRESFQPENILEQTENRTRHLQIGNPMPFLVRLLETPLIILC